jgi:hypothetical protein
MWNGPVSKVFIAEMTIGRCSHMSGLLARSTTADHDEICDADRLITLTRWKRIATNGLIGIEISPLGFITHLAPCRSIQRRTAGPMLLP